jgi:transposase-like protein
VVAPGGDRWFVDESYVKVAGRWAYLYRAIDQHRQVIDVLVSQRRDARAAQAFFTRALTHRASPVKVTTDRAAVYPRVMNALVATARHVTEQDANNNVEADHARLKRRPRPMPGLTTIASLDAVATGHAFVQNPRRGHYPITADPPVHDRVRVAFTELVRCL